eukprot:jgi/Chrzof1/1593/Cz10g13210.t1
MAKVKRQLPAAFADILPGNASLDRFALPTACFALSNNGKLIFGLQDKARRILSHDFHAQKAQANQQSAARQEAKPAGQRWQASEQWFSALEESRKAEEEQREQQQALLAEEALKDISHQLPSFQTSPDNPLIAALAGPSSDDDSSDDEEGEEQGNEDGNAHSSKTPRASSPDVHNLESHLETGSLAPISCGAGETEEVSKVAERVDECIQQLQDLEELQHKLFLEYPHGIPKRIIHELKQKGVNLPSLGFGLSCMSNRTTALVQRC